MPMFALLDRVPVLIKLGCLGLFIITFCFVIEAIRTGQIVQSQLNKLLGLITSITGPTQKFAKSGLDIDTLDKLRTEFSKRQGLHSAWWHRLDDHIEIYIAADDTESYFLTEPVRDLLPYDTVVSETYNGPLFGVIPGILTGSGLTLTFVAILLALSDVHYDKANTVNPITGIDALINGLSGKFLSSIIALILSIVFTFLERYWARRLGEI